MTTLLIGKNGQIGHELHKLLTRPTTNPDKMGSVPDFVSLDYPKIDLSSPDSIVTCLRTHRPSLVLNAAAYTAVDKAESEPDLAMAINGTAPGVIAEELKKTGGALVHYSTDYVFDGTKDSPYTEDDTPNPLSVYGRTKLAGEEAVRSSGIPHLLLRTSWVYGARGSNFLNTMLRLAREREELSIVDDQIGAPTWCRMIAEKTLEVLKKVSPEKVSDLKSDTFSGTSGLYHLTAAGSTSWHNFARTILDLDPRKQEQTLQTFHPIPSTDYPTPARRPLNSRLDCTRVCRTFGIDLPEWRDSLSLVMNDAKGI
jgi:dTDP-4-dehydrorhamnose reductase